MKKICLVTGSTSGIGLAVAQKLSKNNIVIINDYKPLSKDFIAKNFDRPDNVFFYKCDISKKDEILELKKFILNKFDRLDYLVCNAGIMPLPCGIDTINDENIDKTIDTNLKGTFRCLRDLGGIIKDTIKKGGIVNLTSADGIIGEPYAVIYSATKAGIISLTKSFARYFGENIRVNAVAPGLIDTPLTAKGGENPADTTDYSIIKRMGKAEEIADAVEYLLSDKASFITGQILSVDGGFTLK